MLKWFNIAPSSLPDRWSPHMRVEGFCRGHQVQNPKNLLFNAIFWHTISCKVITMELNQKSINRSFLYINYFKMHFFSSFIQNKNCRHKNDVFCQIFSVLLQTKCWCLNLHFWGHSLHWNQKLSCGMSQNAVIRGRKVTDIPQNAFLWKKRHF